MFEAPVVSPPPTIEVAPSDVRFAIAYKTSIDPLANYFTSKTPINPLAKIVWDFPMILLNFLIDSGPISYPVQLGGIPSLTEKIFAGDSLFISLAQRMSVGKWILTFFFLANSTISFTS